MNPRSQSEMPRSLLSNGQKSIAAILALVESVEHSTQVKIHVQQWTEERCSHSGFMWNSPPRHTDQR